METIGIWNRIRIIARGLGSGTACKKRGPSMSTRACSGSAWRRRSCWDSAAHPVCTAASDRWLPAARSPLELQTPRARCMHACIPTQHGCHHRAAHTDDQRPPCCMGYMIWTGSALMSERLTCCCAHLVFAHTVWRKPGCGAHCRNQPERTSQDWQARSSLYTEPA